MAGTDRALPPAGPPLAALQATLLGAVLGGQRLPGGQQLRVPDDMFFERQAEHYLLDEHLAGPVQVAGLSKPLRVMSRSELAERARQLGELAYWHLRPIAVRDGGVGVGLDGRMIRGGLNEPALGLSGVEVTFVQQGNQWVAAGPPTYVAA